MLPTVSCPANRPPEVTTHGSARPCRASPRMVRAIDTYGLMVDRYSGVSGLVGSQGRSHSALRTRESRQMPASRTRTGRRAIGASSRAGSMIVTGHPRMRPTGPIIPLFPVGTLRRDRTNTSCGADSQNFPGPGTSCTSCGPRMISAAGLVHGVAEHGAEHAHAVPDTTRGSGQVDDEHPPGQAG